MAIDVICPGCHKRFQVSDQFAGKKGPCPGCKTIIEIPKLEDVVVIHEKQTTRGGAPAKLESIKRTKTTANKFELLASLVSLTLGLAVTIAGTLVIPDDSNAPGILISGLAGSFFGIGTSLLGYIVLRNPELEIVNDRKTILKVAGIGLLYAVLWRIQVMITNGTLTLEDGLILPGVLVLAIALTVVASFLSMLLLEFEFAQGLIHTSLFIGSLVVYSLILGDLAVILQ